MSDGDELPRAHIKRLVKTKLTELMNDLGPDKSGKAPDGHVQKEALLAFGESAKIFIHYLTATANEICRDGRRQTISVDDVFRAIEELEFAEFGEALKAALEGFKKDAKAKADKKTAATDRKRKAAEDAGEGEEGEGDDGEGTEGGASPEAAEDGGGDDEGDEEEAEGEEGDVQLMRLDEAAAA